MDDFSTVARNFLTTPAAQIVIWVTITAMVLAVGVYLLRRFRGSDEEEQPNASDLLSNFREMHAQGQLSDQEYRNIKTLMASRLQRELKDTEEKR